MVARRTRRGFSLTDFFVVMIVIGILVALLLPALNSARESARRSVCASNAKQLTLALHMYADQQRAFPASAFYHRDNRDSFVSQKISQIVPGSSIREFRRLVGLKNGSFGKMPPGVFGATVQGNWGCLPEHYPKVLDLVLSGRIAIEPFVEQRPLASINETFVDIHAHRTAGRVILTPEH